MPHVRNARRSRDVLRAHASATRGTRQRLLRAQCLLQAVAFLTRVLHAESYTRRCALHTYLMHGSPHRPPFRSHRVLVQDGDPV
jgi:hypothetical protein